MEKNEDVGLLLLLWVLVLAMLFYIGTTKFTELPAEQKSELTETSTEQNSEFVENSVETVEKSRTITQCKYSEIEVVITAYCPCVKCCGKSDGITSTGRKAIEGRTIAVDPRHIPYGTEVVIDGHTYIAEDCGGAIKGNNKIDLFFDSHSEALAFGIQTKIVKVME